MIHHHRALDDLNVFLIDRAMVEAGETMPVSAALQQLLMITPKTVRANAGTLEVVFQGYV